MQLKSQGERKVVCIHSGMDEQEKRKYQLLNQSRFIFLSPEFILQSHHFNLIKTSIWFSSIR